MKIKSFEDAVNVFELGIYFPILLWIYRRLIPFRVKRIRKKQQIKVLFIVTERATWKTEMLYLAMCKHPRFNPILAVCTSGNVPFGLPQLKNYLDEQNYNYVDLDNYNTWTIKKISPDIIFYGKPYPGEYKYGLYFDKHLNSLFCHVQYGCHSVIEPWAAENWLLRFCWQQYFENQNVLDQFAKAGKMSKKYLVATGFPVFDRLMSKKELVADPWKCKDGRKRIIYAPHHTIGELHAQGIGYSTFLEMGEIMLDLAEKYKDEVVFCFKPHTILYSKLVAIWGQERADRYYNAWRTKSNCQFEDGDYQGIFLHSDAMIHDCASFTIEYHFTHNPVLYLVRDETHDKNMTNFAKRAFDAHYKGQNKEDVERFIKNVISGYDPMRSEREQYFNEYLLPPNGKSACDNIIDAILGQN